MTMIKNMRQFTVMIFLVFSICSGLVASPTTLNINTQIAPLTEFKVKAGSDIPSEDAAGWAGGVGAAIIENFDASQEGVVIGCLMIKTNETHPIEVKVKALPWQSESSSLEYHYELTINNVLVLAALDASWTVVRVTDKFSGADGVAYKVLPVVYTAPQDAGLMPAGQWFSSITVGIVSV